MGRAPPHDRGFAHGVRKVTRGSPRRPEQADRFLEAREGGNAVQHTLLVHDDRRRGKEAVAGRQGGSLVHVALDHGDVGAESCELLDPAPSVGTAGAVLAQEELDDVAHDDQSSRSWGCHPGMSCEMWRGSHTGA